MDVTESKDEVVVADENWRQARVIPTSGIGVSDEVAGTGLILSGPEVELVSPTALRQWKNILLLEDDSARASRRQKAGVAAGNSQVLVRIHRIGSGGIRIAAERVYAAGLLRTSETTRRADLALDLLDGVPSKGSVVVCGPSYGASPRFLDGLGGLGIACAVEIRPTSLVTLEGRGRTFEPVVASELLDRASWRNVTIPVPGVVGRNVTYAVAQFGSGRLGSGPVGTIFAALTGGIHGVHPGTVFGFSTTANATLDELMESVGWTRWIRPLVRRLERTLVKREPTSGSDNSSVPNGVRPRLRANIKLSRRHDQADAAARLIEEPKPNLRHILASPTKTLNVVELFAGAGGMGLGFLLAGTDVARYRLLYAGEVDPIYVQTLRRNHAVFDGNAPARASVTPAQVEPVDLRARKALNEVASTAEAFNGTDVLIGGPPCQGFSNANRNSWHSSNPNNQLIDVFLNYVARLKPRVFLLENVQGIHWTRKSGTPQAESSVLDHIRRRMAVAGYEVFVQLLDAVWYGVPQYRSRFFILGIHRDLGYGADSFGAWGPFPPPTHGPGTAHEYVTVSDAIRDLPRVENGCAVEELHCCDPTTSAPSANGFLSFVRRGAEQGMLTDHVTSRHADYVIDRYRKIPPGGNWESIAETLTNYANVNRTHSNIYRRLLWTEPSITIGHYRKSMLVHPSQHRGLSLREASRLQSFPDWFRFAGNPDSAPGGLVHKQQQLANAVCPLVTKAIAEFILEL